MTAARLAELTVGAGHGDNAPLTLSRTEALWLFDRRSREDGAALRTFIQESAWGPALSSLSDRDLVALVRKEIGVGALIAVLAGPPAKLYSRRPRIEEAAPVPIRRAPPPAAAEEEPDEDIEFKCPELQALALVAAAESGIPFCAECARAAALRSAGVGA